MNTPPVIPYGRQSIDDDDAAAVLKALRSDFLTTGPVVQEFERTLAEVCDAKHAVAVANGTAALHVAMLAAGIGSGARVITSPNTFLASANAAEFVGATADFADIDDQTYNLNPTALAATWRPDTRAVVAVDFAGQTCDLPAIAALARERGAVVIEDAAHALGSTFAHEGQRYRVGGHPWADLTTLSFHPVKTITTGEGGAILTNDDHLAARCREFRSHGMVRQPDQPHSPAADWGTGPWYYEMAELGFNYRITDIQCALGLTQLARLDRFIARRAEIVAAYNATFAHLPHVTLPRAAPGAQPAWHLYVLQLDFDGLGTSRTACMDALRRRGIGTQVHYIPVHLQPYYVRKYGYTVGKCPLAEAYYRHCLSLPLYPAMSDADVARVINAVTEFVHAP